MAYKRQNFSDGDVLTAENLNHIEDGISDVEKNASKSVIFEYQLLSDTQKAQVRTNIGALGQKDLENATNVALEKAKASGEFNGKDGQDGTNGTDGVDGKDGADGKTPYIQGGYWYIDGKNTGVKAQGVDGTNGTDGTDGKDGQDGKDGTSVTHSWNGTTLTITSASGTSSANLKGEKGDKGDPYTLTETDKAVIVQSVIDALPKYNGEVIEL